MTNVVLLLLLVDAEHLPDVRARSVSELTAGAPLDAVVVAIALGSGGGVVEPGSLRQRLTRFEWPTRLGPGTGRETRLVEDALFGARMVLDGGSNRAAITMRASVDWSRFVDLAQALDSHPGFRSDDSGFQAAAMRQAARTGQATTPTGQKTPTGRAKPAQPAAALSPKARRRKSKRTKRRVLGFVIVMAVAAATFAGLHFATRSTSSSSAPASPTPTASAIPTFDDVIDRTKVHQCISALSQYDSHTDWQFLDAPKIVSCASRAATFTVSAKKPSEKPGVCPTSTVSWTRTGETICLSLVTPVGTCFGSWKSKGTSKLSLPISCSTRPNATFTSILKVTTAKVAREVSCPSQKQVRWAYPNSPGFCTQVLFGGR